MAKFSMENIKGKENPLSEKISVIENKDKFDIRFIDPHKIIPNPSNFYEVTGIETLAENIKEFGLMQNLEVLEFLEGEEKKYRLIGGHRRFEAIKLLRSQGEEFDAIPCKVNKNLSAEDELLRLCKSNSDTRELTAKEKRLQIETLTKLYKTKKSLTGEEINITKAIANDINSYDKTVQRYANINEKLIPDLKTYFDDNKITYTDAYRFATLDEQMQLAILDILQVKDKVSQEELVAIRTQNKKLIDETSEKNKELQNLQNSLKTIKDINKELGEEKKELEDLAENNKVEQDVIEEEKKKLEKKIREEISQLTEEELTKAREELEESEKKSKDLQDKQKQLEDQLKNKDEEHRRSLEEYKKNLAKQDKVEEEIKEGIVPLISKEQIEVEVAKSKIQDIKNNVTLELVTLGTLIKKHSLLEGAEELVVEMEKGLQVLKNMVNNTKNN